MRLRRSSLPRGKEHRPGTGAVAGAPGGGGQEDETSIIKVWLETFRATFPVELVTAYSSQIT